MADVILQKKEARKNEAESIHEEYTEINTTTFQKDLIHEDSKDEGNKVVEIKKVREEVDRNLNKYYPNIDDIENRDDADYVDDKTKEELNTAFIGEDDMAQGFSENDERKEVVIQNNEEHQDLKKNDEQKEAVIQDNEEHQDASVDNELLLGRIEAKFVMAARDTARAALYYKVRDAIALYREETDQKQKEQLLLAVRESAYNYLLEKRGNAPQRKQICQEIVNMVDQYVDARDISRERNLDDLIRMEAISDRRLDLEINLAGKRTVNASVAFKGNLKDRRKAFRRKIRDVRLAREILSDLESSRESTLKKIDSLDGKYEENDHSLSDYDKKVRNIVAAYMNLPDVQIELLGGKATEDTKHLIQDNQKRLGRNMLARLSAPKKNQYNLPKMHMAEVILTDILSWDPADFSFREPGDFLNRFREDKKEGVLKLCNRLQIAQNADVLVALLENLKKDPGVSSQRKLDDRMLAEARARISMYREVGREYQNRLELMKSPYYALLLQSDTDGYNTQEELSALTKTQKAENVTGDKQAGGIFRRFLSSLKKKFTRLKFGRRTGLEFTRNTNLQKLLKEHRKAVGAQPNFDDRQLLGVRRNILLSMEEDNRNAKLMNSHMSNDENIILEENGEEEGSEKDLISNDEKQKDRQKKQKERSSGKTAEDLITYKNPIALSKNDVDAEMLERGKNQRKLWEEEKYQKEFKEKFQKELKEKQTDMKQQHEKGAAKVSAEMEQRATERIRWVLEYEKLQEMLDDYNSLAESKDNMEKAYALRERMVNYLKNFIKDSNKEEYRDLIFSTVDDLVEWIRYVQRNLSDHGAGKELANKIADYWKKEEDNDKNIDTPLLQLADGIRRKNTPLTTQDRLRAHDLYCQVIYVNRYYEDYESEVEVQSHYKEYGAFDLDTLARFAQHSSDYYYTDPPGDNFENLTEEQIEAHKKVCIQILSESTKKEPDYFRVIPIQDLTDYAYDVLDILDKDTAEKAAAECKKRADEIHERLRTIKNTLQKDEWTGMISVAQSESGLDRAELKRFTTLELGDLLTELMKRVSKGDGLEKAMGELVSDLLSKRRKSMQESDDSSVAAYHKFWMHECRKKVLKDVDKLDKKEPDPVALRNMKDHGILYLMEQKGLESLTFEDFVNLDPEEVYSLCQNTGMIEAFRDSVNPYDQRDRRKAMMKVAELKLSEKLKTALEKKLHVDFSQIPEEVAIKEEPGVVLGVENELKMKKWEKSAQMLMQEKKEDLRKSLVSMIQETRIEEVKNVIHDEGEKNRKEMHILKQLDDYDLERKKQEKEEERNQRTARQRELDEIHREKRKKTAAKAEREQERFFSEAATNLLTILGEITALTGKGKLDNGMPLKIRNVLVEHLDELRSLLHKDSNRMLMAAAAFRELKTGCTEGERKFFEACENSLMPVINAIIENMGGMKDLKTVVEGGRLDQEIEAFSQELEKNLQILEGVVLPAMTEATSDIFNRGEDYQDFPDFKEAIKAMENQKTTGEFGQILDLLDEIEEKQRQETKKNAKTTKEKLELEKKTDDQIRKERQQLMDMKDDMLYNGKKGQGRFTQLLISGYYQNAAKADRRRMLSFVLKDLKKKNKNENASPRERGCEYFASTMKGAGPLMQKMMQGVPERMVIPELSGALGIVKSSLAPIDRKYVNEVIQKIIKDSKKTITSITIVESLGAASVAETFLCKISGPRMKSQKVVLKILRPDAEKNMEKDLAFVQRMAMYADMSDDEVREYEKKYGKKMANHPVKVTESGFLAQFSEIRKEFDFTNEVKNAEMGQENYVKRYAKKTITLYPGDKPEPYRVRSVQINNEVSPQKNYIFMDLAPGITADKLITRAKSDYKNTVRILKNTDASSPQRLIVNSSNVGEIWKKRNEYVDFSWKIFEATELVAQLAYIWLEQALFGEGPSLLSKPHFHHGDLHAGNIMLNLKDYGKGILTVLDYGNAAVIMTERISKILAMISAAAISDAGNFVKAFDEMLKLSQSEEMTSKEKVGYAPLTEGQKKAFIAKLDTLFKLGDERDTGKKILVALDLAQTLGVKLPREIQNFSQCQQRMENSLQELRDGTQKIVNLIHNMDNLPVAPEDEDSFDPLIRLQIFHRDKNNRTKKKVKAFAQRYDIGEVKDLPGLCSCAKSKEELDKKVKAFLPNFQMLQKKIPAKVAKEKADAWREVFSQISAKQKKGEEVSSELAGKMKMYGKEFEELANETNYFDGMIDRLWFSKRLQAGFIPAGGQSYDEEAFEELTEIMGVYIPTLQEAIQNMRKATNSVDLSKCTDQTDYENQLAYSQLNLLKLADQTLALIVAYQPESLEIRNRLRHSKGGAERRVFEHQAERMMKDDEAKETYEAYRKAERVFDEAEKSKNTDRISQAERDKLRWEAAFAYRMIFLADKDLKDIYKDYNQYIPSSTSVSDGVLPDFSDMMERVVKEHWELAAYRVGGSLRKAIYNEKKKKDAVRKKIEEEEKKKRKEEEKKKMEEEKKKKEEEEKKRKEEEKKKKEEEKKKEQGKKKKK